MTDMNFTDTAIQIIPFMYHRTTSEFVNKLGTLFQIIEEEVQAYEQRHLICLNIIHRRVTFMFSGDF